MELALTAYMTYGIAYFVEKGVYSSIPFRVLSQVGFGYVALRSIYEELRGRVLRWSRIRSASTAAQE